MKNCENCGGKGTTKGIDYDQASNTIEVDEDCIVCGNPSDQFLKFETALTELCREHGVLICSSMYDAVEVRTLKDDDKPACDHLSDETD